MEKNNTRRSWGRNSHRSQKRSSSNLSNARDDGEERKQQGHSDKRTKAVSRKVLVTFYTLGLALLHADYNILSPNLTQVAEEFGMTHEERDMKLGGQIALAFFLCGVPSAFVVGWLSDTVKLRAPIFAIVILIGELSCFATYFVSSFAGLMVTRMITGISIGGSLPVVYSVLGDLYRAEGRNAISGVIAASVGIGLGIGQAIGKVFFYISRIHLKRIDLRSIVRTLAGYLGPTYGWRLPFLCVSIPSLVVGICSFFLPEPDRGSQERAVLELASHRSLSVEERESDNFDEMEVQCSRESLCSPVEDKEIEMKVETEVARENSIVSPNGHYQQLSIPGSDSFRNRTTASYSQVMDKPNLGTTCQMLRTPTLILILLQGAPNVIPFGIASVFLNDYLAQEKGLTTEQATSVLLVFGAGNAFGVIIGSTIGHFTYKVDVRLPALLMGVSVILTCLPMFFVINMSYEEADGSIATASAMVFLSGLLSIIPIPIERAILTNVTLPESRGRANSFLNIIDDLGKGLGPFFLSIIIKSFGRRRAFNLSLMGWVIGGIICLGMIFTVSKDEDKIQKHIRVKMGAEEEETR